jgi:chromosome segregation ATPase
MIIDENGLPLAGTGPAATRVNELEAQLGEQNRLRVELERQLKQTEQSRLNAEAQVQQLSSQMEHLRTTTTTDSSTVVALDARAAEAERKLAEAEATHQAKVQQVEGDYLAAVRYIKGTEKLLRRMKDDLQKQKAANSSLQLDLEAARSSDSGSRRGDGSPTSDDMEQLRSQLSDSQRSVQKLTQENQNFQRRLEKMQLEIQQLQDNLLASQQESETRLSHIEELETDIERLQASLAVARNGHDESLAEQLTRENQALKRENDLLSHKIGILLDVDHNNYNNDRPISMDSRRDSQASIDNDMTYDSLANELDYWHGKLANTTGSHRRLSELDPDPTTPLAHDRKHSRS